MAWGYRAQTSTVCRDRQRGVSTAFNDDSGTCPDSSRCTSQTLCVTSCTTSTDVTSIPRGRVHHEGPLSPDPASQPQSAFFRVVEVEVVAA